MFAVLELVAVVSGRDGARVLTRWRGSESQSRRFERKALALAELAVAAFTDGAESGIGAVDGTCRAMRALRKRNQERARSEGRALTDHELAVNVLAGQVNWGIRRMGGAS